MALKYLIRLGCQNQRLTVYTVSAVTSICLLKNQLVIRNLSSMPYLAYDTTEWA